MFPPDCIRNLLILILAVFFLLLQPPKPRFFLYVLFPDHLAITECEIWVVEISAPFRSEIGTSLGKDFDLLGLFRWITETPGFLRGAICFLLEKTEEWVKSNLMEIWELSHVIYNIYIYGTYIYI